MPTRRAVAKTTVGDPSTIRAFFLTPLIRELGGSGIATDAFLRRYGLSAGQLANLYEQVPLRHFVALAEDAAKRLERPFLGLELGKNFSLADLGPFYALFILSKDLRTALNHLVRFQSAWQTNTVLELIPGSPSACRYCIEDPSIWPRCQDAEFAMASFTSFIRELTSTRWHPLAVEFEHDVTHRAPRLTEFFNAPIHGNCGANQIIFSSSDLDKRLRWRFDAGAHDVAPILERHLMQLLAPPGKVNETVAARADALVARRLGRGLVTAETVAAEMNMSARSLRRRLTAEGTSFRQILQTHRRTTIESILRANGAPLSDLANRLSYSDPAVLSRAFKTWTGMSPRAYAKSQKR